MKRTLEERIEKIRGEVRLRLPVNGPCVIEIIDELLEGYGQIRTTEAIPSDQGDL